MDQAASVISTPASALYVTFYPKLAAALVPLPGAASTNASSTADAASLPPKAVFIIANSLVTSEKAVHARTRYNLRVVETLVAARILAHKLNLPVGPKERITLREVVGRIGGEPEGGWKEGEDGDYKKALERMAGECEQILKPAREDGQQGVTMEEMVALSGMEEKLFKEVYLDWIDGILQLVSHTLSFPLTSICCYSAKSRQPTSSCTSAPNTSSPKPFACSNSGTSVSLLPAPPPPKRPSRISAPSCKHLKPPVPVSSSALAPNSTRSPHSPSSPAPTVADSRVRAGVDALLVL